ncbi:hypothetical protein CIPAW_13G157700 [Carya illinoinensis]|uniref:Disease resistance N-terminal domain-containing protein n=1 Tax=Carya illinoinensis TaxID=32201 RepID=A0A8T1NU39_CARIL|nr:hypothetical protein CIPAW_13G157700 [Carya illinoinensis]
MAEAIIVNVAAKIIESLGSQALKEIGLLWGVKDELEKLQNTFSTIQAVLRDAEEQSAVNLQVRDWLEKLKDVAYDADDLLDGFSTVHLLREMMTRDKMAKKATMSTGCNGKGLKASSLWSLRVCRNWCLSHWGFNMLQLYESSESHLVRAWWLYQSGSAIGHHLRSSQFLVAMV